MTAPRQVLPGSTYSITRRCTQRLQLLRPDPVVNQAFHYCLADAAKRSGIQVFGWQAMSNHYHALVHDPYGLLPEFLEHFHKLLARVLNCRWGRFENFWSTETTCAVRAVRREDVLDQMIYVLSNPVAAHLVERVADWPGASSLAYMGSNREIVVDRPRFFFRTNGKMPETVSLRIDTPEGFEPQAWADLVRQGVAERERAAREERMQNGSRVVGRKAVLAASPFEAPSTPSPRNKLRPTLACKHRETRILELQAIKVFRQHYARALDRIRSGDRTALFPAGSYRWPRLKFVGSGPPIHRPSFQSAA